MKRTILQTRAMWCAATLLATATLTTAGFAAPMASSSPSNVTLAGGTSYSFTVTYQDAGSINVSSLGNGDVRVSGSSFLTTPTFVASAPSTNASVIVATYTLHPAGRFVRQRGQRALYAVDECKRGL